MKKLTPMVPAATMLSVPEQYRQMFGYIMCALYKQGIFTAYITREEIEDDMWTQVNVTRHDDVESGGIRIFWSVRGMPKAEVRPGIMDKIAPEPARLGVKPWYLLIIAALGIVLGFLIGRAY